MFIEWEVRVLMEGFTAEQASRFTGSTPHQLRYWDRIALVRPSIQRTGGRPGVRRVYSFRDLVALKMVCSLLHAGMSLQQVRRAFAYLRKKERLEEHLSAVKLMSDGASIYEVGNSEGFITDALREGQMAFFTTIEDLVRNGDGRVPGYLYDRERFIAALNEVEANLQQEGGGSGLGRRPSGEDEVSGEVDGLGRRPPGEDGAPPESVELQWAGVPEDPPAVLRVDEATSAAR